MQVSWSLDRFHWGSVSRLAVVASFMFASFPVWLAAQQPRQKTFSSAQEASEALVAAAQSNDQNEFIEILGPDAEQVVTSGDETEDAQNRANFVQRYEQMHRLVKEPDGTTTLYIGAENWPMPVPLVNRGGSWYFDTAAGRKEILYRRVGRNEMSTIRVCLELVRAENEYYSTHDNAYAQKVMSDKGQQDGLYWEAGQGQPPSPVGPLVAAAAEGYHTTTEGAPANPYRGYYYHILTGQGANAPGGVKSYLENGRMTGGFAFVAYPAEYRSSGVVTFIVGSDGVVYRKDLGPNTAAIAKATKVYDPDSTWEKDEDQQEESAAERKAN